MSNTTQILFNSPALHSPKREQLVKLCKLHSLKATGKNVELIEKLKQHALTLPQNSPLSIAARSEDATLSPHTSELLFSERPRPSEQWEVVMDSIDETDEVAASQGTVTSQRTVGQDKAAGEFGTGGSKSTVGSSLMALATSLGLKRPGTTQSSSVKSHSNTADAISESDQLTRFTHLPPATSVPQTDLFSSNDGFYADVDMEEPVPGGTLRPGIPAPDNARLSMGRGLTAPQTPSKRLQPTTTIRLVQNLENMRPSTPQLAPFKTTFDLIMSPRMATGVGFGTLTSATTWSSSIYPTLPTDISDPAIRESSPVCMATNVASGVAGSDEDITMPGALSCPSVPAFPSAKIAVNAEMISISGDNTLERPLNEPFIFGSPLPKHRVSDAQFRETAASVLDEMNKRLQADGIGTLNMDIIKRLHPTSHGEGIQTLADSGVNKCQASEIKQMFDKKHQAEFEKMEGIDAHVKRKAAKFHGQLKQGSNDKGVVGEKRKSSVLIDEPRRIPSQVAGRASGTRVISNGRRSKMIPGAFESEDFDRETDAEDERGKKRVKVENRGVEVDNTESQAQKEKEREAIRRKLEVSKARRRSNRQSGGVSLGRVQQKQKPSRFNFLAQAKSIVQSVFGRSKVASSTVTGLTASSKAKAGRQDPEPGSKIPTASSSRGPVDNLGLTGSITNTNSKTSLGSRASTTLDEERRSFSSMRSRSSIPTHIGSGTMLAQVKLPSASVAVTHSGSNCSSSDKSNTGPKLPGQIPSTSISKLAANVSAASGSFGVKKAGDRGQSSLSRLHAPTASSLAKMGGRIPVGTTSLRDNKQNIETPAAEPALSSITNNVTRGPTLPPVSGQIFSKPFTIGSTIDNERHSSNFVSETTFKHPLQRQRTLSSRKPRISRSKVISRLASQRASATKNNGPAADAIHRPSAAGKPLSTPRTRSSLSANVKTPIGRSSHTGVGLRNGAGDVLMSAKKRARQSEYHARRRSRTETGAINP